MAAGKLQAAKNVHRQLTMLKHCTSGVRAAFTEPFHTVTYIQCSGSADNTSATISCLDSVADIMAMVPS